MPHLLYSLLCRNVLCVGRHGLARKRRKSPVVLAALLAPAAVFFAVAGRCPSIHRPGRAKPVIGDIAPCRLEIVAAAPNLPHSAAGVGCPGGQPAAASRYHIRSRFLPVGVARSRAYRSERSWRPAAISAAFPEIHEIGGVRPDPLPWHPLGLALDVMIPSPESAAGNRAGQRDRRVRAEERASIRHTGRDLARRLLHAQRSASEQARPLRPRPRHDDRRRIPQGWGNVPRRLKPGQRHLANG